MPDNTARIPAIGLDGLRRFDCPKCGKLIFRFSEALKGGPIQLPCRPSCKDSQGNRTIHNVFFNEAGPSWD
jgi:hypothetical protein